MKFEDIKTGSTIRTIIGHNLSSDMSGDWQVKRTDKNSFTIVRDGEDYEEHFSPCASVNFEIL